MILITGASEGIGFACARALLQSTGSTVLITGRSTEKLDRARDRLPDWVRQRVVTMASDQRSRADVEDLMGRLREADIEGALLTVGVNPLYACGPRRLHAVSADIIESTIRTNCTHTVLITAWLLQRFRRRGGGVLVWVGSQAQAVGMPGAAIYCATKSFLSGLARATANEYAHFGIRVHLAHPGLVRTPRTEAIADRFAGLHGLSVADVDQVGGKIADLIIAGDPDTLEVDVC